VNRFNLTFWGEILAGRDPEKVRARFARLFEINDPERIEHFFSGETITLRRNLERKVAAEYYAKLRKLGVEARLVKIDSDAQLAAENGPADLPRDDSIATDSDPDDKASQWEAARRRAELETLERARKVAPSKRAASQDQATSGKRHEPQRDKAPGVAGVKHDAGQKAREQAVAAAREEEARQAALKEAAAKAEREAAEKIAAEEAARKKAERDEARRKAEQEARRRKAERQEAQRRAAEEVARKKAALEEKKRLARERAERERALREEAKRKADEEAAKQIAREKEAQRKKEALEKQRAAEARKAREAEARRRRAQERARRAEKRARVEAQRKQEQVEREKRLAEEKQRKAREREQAIAREREQQAQIQRMEDQAIARAASELAAQPGLKPAAARVRSRLDLPRRGTATSSRRQPGSPNLYQIHPFRNTPEVRARAAQAAEKTRGGFTLAAIALALLLILAGRYLSMAPAPPLSGPEAVATAPGGALLLMAGDTFLLHDRSGTGKLTVEATALDLGALRSPMAYSPGGQFFIRSQTGNQPDAAATLYRCDAGLSNCEPLSRDLPDMQVDSLSVHPLTGDLFVADLQAGELMKLSPEGRMASRATLDLPTPSVMQLDSGLLFINSNQGPAISVFRYEDSAFGRQLDEILLLPPPAVEQHHSRVSDFIRVGDFWWVLMSNPDNGSTGVYLFDSQWNFQRQIQSKHLDRHSRLHSWGTRALIWSPQRATIQRFAAGGKAEAPFKSELLQALLADRKRNHRLLATGWFAGFSLLFLTVVVSFARSYHQYLRNLVYRSRPAQGSDPIDEYAASIDWVDPLADRSRRLQRTSFYWVVLGLGIACLCIGLGASVSQLTAALIALAGPLAALAFFKRGEIGHAGTAEDKLVLVDHRDMYHIASGARIQYRGPFLMIDDVVVFTGSRLLPVLAPAQVSSRLRPLAQTGIRIDRKTVAVKLLEHRHPLVAAALSIAVALMLAGLTLLWAQLFRGLLAWT